jgi:Alcohol dehydrogenase GroES-like domain
MPRAQRFSLHYLKKEFWPADFPETVVILDEGSSLQNEISLYLQEDLGKAGSPTVHLASLEQAAFEQDLSRMFCIFLLEAEHPILRNVNSKMFLTIRDIITTAEGVLWMMRGGGSTPALPDHVIVNGLVRTVKQENIKTKFVTVAFEPEKTTVSQFAKTILEVYAKTVSSSLDDYEPGYVEREGRLCIDRFVEAHYLNREIALRLATQQHQTKQFEEVPSLALSISSPGLLDTLEFIEDKGLTRPLDRDEIEIKVQASDVNFRDFLIALGRIPSTNMGFECSGNVLRVGDECKDLKPGDRVCANAVGTYQTYARCKAVHATPLPEHTSFLEGTALPVVFTTAYYALYHVARITDGESILIHSGAGGTGQAAIQIANLFNADIYDSGLR